MMPVESTGRNVWKSKDNKHWRGKLLKNGKASWDNQNESGGEAKPRDTSSGKLQFNRRISNRNLGRKVENGQPESSAVESSAGRPGLKGLKNRSTNHNNRNLTL